jgi:hypothetical protein
MLLLTNNKLESLDYTNSTFLHILNFQYSFQTPFNRFRLLQSKWDVQNTSNPKVYLMVVFHSFERCFLPILVQLFCVLTYLFTHLFAARDLLIYLLFALMQLTQALYQAFEIRGNAAAPFPEKSSKSQKKISNLKKIYI